MNRFGKTFAALSGALIVGALIVTPAFAWPNAFDGRPSGAIDGGELGYYIWHDEDGVHLRTTGPGPRHVFRATLTTDGDFQDIQLVRLEGDDGYEVRDGGQRLELRFETWDGVDGVDFRVEGGQAVRFALRIDGELAPLRRIFLGENGRHPWDNPFGISR